MNPHTFKENPKPVVNKVLGYFLSKYAFVNTF
ncbi:unnamed protein product, partial [marine sediment metagenome]